MFKKILCAISVLLFSSACFLNAFAEIPEDFEQVACTGMSPSRRLKKGALEDVW